MHSHVLMFMLPARGGMEGDCWGLENQLKIRFPEYLSKHEIKINASPSASFVSSRLPPSLLAAASLVGTHPGAPKGWACAK